MTQMYDMEINVVYLVVFMLGAIFGSVIAWLITKKHYKDSWLRKVIRAKNPELWDLAHYVVADDEETQKTTKIKK